MIQLQNADCRAVLPHLPDASVDLFYADPPWGESNHAWDVTVDGWAAHAARVMKTHGSLWVTTSMRHFYTRMHDELTSNGFRFVQDIVVEHPNGNGPTMAPEFRKVHHHAMHFRLDGSSRSALTRNRPYHGRKMARSVILNADPKRRWHPAQQPLNLLHDIIAYSTNEGDQILDPFAGSGTTAIAAAYLGRECMCIEKDFPIYQTALARLAEHGITPGIPFTTEKHHVEDQAQRSQPDTDAQPATGRLGSAIPDAPRVQRRGGIFGRLRSRRKA